jgi:hypothetical protein
MGESQRKRGARPLYQVFLERVINIPAVQHYRAAAIGDYESALANADWDKLKTFGYAPHMALRFFSEGFTYGQFGEFVWSLDEPEEFYPRMLWDPDGDDRLVSPPLLHALLRGYNAACGAVKEWIKEIIDNEWIASGVNEISGARFDLDSAAEFTRTGLVLNMRNGDLSEARKLLPWEQLAAIHRHDYELLLTRRWSAMTLRAAESGTAKSTERSRETSSSVSDLPFQGKAPLKTWLPAAMQDNPRRLGEGLRAYFHRLEGIAKGRWKWTSIEVEYYAQQKSKKS